MPNRKFKTTSIHVSTPTVDPTPEQKSGKSRVKRKRLSKKAKTNQDETPKPKRGRRQTNTKKKEIKRIQDLAEIKAKLKAPNVM